EPNYPILYTSDSANGKWRGFCRSKACGRPVALADKPASGTHRESFCMKLSIVIICWNDLKVIPACLASIYEQTRKTEFEVILSDNGSTDGSLEFIRANYPQVRIVGNKP